jgi:hypothetical protein
VVVIEAAAGERIVAFAQPGKPPAIPVLVTVRRCSAPAYIPDFGRVFNGF